MAVVEHRLYVYLTNTCNLLSTYLIITQVLMQSIEISEQASKACIYQQQINSMLAVQGTLQGMLRSAYGCELRPARQDMWIAEQAYHM